jgi:hypothetical protein
MKRNSMLGEPGNINNAQTTEAKLVGSEKAKRRRAEMVAELTDSLAEGGPQAVTPQIARRMDTLVDAFAVQLQQLKKQL